MHFKISIRLLFLCLLLNCNDKSAPITEIQIIPEPNHKEISGIYFNLGNSTDLIFPEELKVSARFLKTYLEGGSAIKLKSSPEKNSIRFIKNDSITHPEGYELEVLKNDIIIKASTDRGAFYAVQSLRQLLPVEFESSSYKAEDVDIPGVRLKDQPHFSYRGMHLDVGRHRYSTEFIKSYIDALAMLKMNVFHWHLTEDQGWRIEIKKYPKLQEVSAYRKETLIGHFSDQPQQFDGKKYGGYYSQDEIKDIVAYAQERFVTIIPEIEMPGHSQAAIAAYPELGCSGKQVEVATKWGVFEDIYCTKEQTFVFLENVLDEVLELFPSEYIHIGGDEAPKTRWKACANCQARIKSEGLKNEHELQNYFITRIERYLNSKGRQIIGWDEILEGGLAPNATVMSWRGTKGAVEAAKAGHNVVMTPTSHCYFDYYQSDDENEPLAIGGSLPLEKVYSFNPIPEELTATQSNFVLGAQGNIWTEYMPNEDQVEYMAFPRMLAMSEVVWSQPAHKNYDNFVSRVEVFFKRLEALDINYANHLYEIKGQMIIKSGTPYYELKTVSEEKTIRYTLDGSEPDLSSEIYKSYIPITNTCTLKSAVFSGDKKLGKTMIQQINYHKALGAKITIDKKPHNAFAGTGPEGLLNGISGSNSRFGDQEWIGFWGDDIEIMIDLGKETQINSIETRFHNGKDQWIYAPKEFKFGFQKGGVDSEVEVLAMDKTIIPIQIKADVKSQYIYLKIPNYGTIPEGRQGAGNKAWTFIDEIIIN